jgi:hypothetical protein
LLALLVLHGAAALVCFGVFTVAPIVACFIVIVISGDPGGPLFIPVFVVGVVVFAAVMTLFLSVAVLVSDVLCRHYRTPRWLPFAVVYVLATGLFWFFSSGIHPLILLIGGAIVEFAFLAHWAAISTIWLLPRLLFRLLGIQSWSPTV